MSSTIGNMYQLASWELSQLGPINDITFFKHLDKYIKILQLLVVSKPEASILEINKLADLCRNGSEVCQLFSYCTPIRIKN